eukprot:m.105343 g.105343  ORF g.105343 m.105343 type:complete len:374 (-) comp16867_c0_seq1:145-1266(-)
MTDEDCIYDDYDVADDSSNAGGVEVMFESLYVSNDVANQPWYCGRIDRAESERRLKQGGRAGNFLVRMKGDDGNTFVHSYLSLTRMVIIHNLIQFKPNGSCIVDDKPFPFSKKPQLADVVDKLQELRRARKGVSMKPDPIILGNVRAIWKDMQRQSVTESIKEVQFLKTGMFLSILSRNSDGYTLVMKTSTSQQELECPRSKLGLYLKYSELVAPSIEELVAVMIGNPDACRSAGVKCPMRLPDLNARAAPGPPIPQRNEEHIYGDDIYDESGPPPSLAAKSVGGQEDTFSDDDIAENIGYAIEEDIYDSEPVLGSQVEEVVYGDDAGAPPPIPQKKRAAPPVPQEDVVYGDDAYPVDNNPVYGDETDSDEDL